MQFERLKKSHRKEILIGGMILVCVISAITITTTRAKYKLTENIKIASGTINYKPYDFKMMAMYKSEDGTNYTEITTMPTSGYVVNESKSYCTTDNKTQVKGKIKTENGKHYITGITKNDKCYVYFDKKTPENVTELIVSLNAKTTTPNFKTSATTDEGVYKTEDGMYGGFSYYWRGAVTNNHIIFANKCWRIIRINGDNSIRLIYNGTVNNGSCKGNGSNAESVMETGQDYNTNQDRSEYVGYTYTTGSQRGATSSSNLKIQTEAWFNNNSNFTNAQRDQVANGYFCNDRNVAPGYDWNSQPTSDFYYASYDRRNGSPTLSCANASDKYTLKVGAITMDEVIMAGGKWGTTNNKYYLYNNKYYWTMSPYYWYYGSSTSYRAFMFDVNMSGALDYTTVKGDTYIRPVINLNSNVKFNSGSDGTQNNPYIVQ